MLTEKQKGYHMNIIKNLMLLCFVAFPLASYAGHGESSEEEKPPISNISYFDLSPEIVTAQRPESLK